MSVRWLINMKSIKISRLMQCKPLMVLTAFVTFSLIMTSCNRHSAIIMKKVLHDYEHAIEHHERQNNGGEEEWVVEQDSYQEQDSYNNGSTNREEKLSVDGIAVSNGYMYPLKTSCDWAIVTQDDLFLMHNMIRIKAYMNNESTIRVHINVFEIPVNDDIYPEYKTIDVSTYKFKSQDDLQTYYFNVYN